MHVVDAGSGEWWQVDVVLRPPPDSGDLHDRLLELVRAASQDVDEVPSVVRDPEQTYSFDMSPPEGDLGVAVWVRAPEVGSAVQGAWRLVASCVRGLDPHHEPQLWDLRIVPVTAVLHGPQASAAVKPLRIGSKRRWWRYKSLRIASRPLG